MKIIVLFFTSLLTLAIFGITAQAAFMDGCLSGEELQLCMDRIEGTYQLLDNEQFADTDRDGDVDKLDIIQFAKIYGKTAWYVDRDQNGKGDPSKVIYVNGQPQHDWLFVRQGGDTNDHGADLDRDGDGWQWPEDCDDHNHFTHPNAPARNIARSNGSWDWDCSGTLDKSLPAIDTLGNLTEEECHNRMVLLQDLECGSTPPIGLIVKGELTWDVGLQKCNYINTLGVLKSQAAMLNIFCK